MTATATTRTMRAWGGWCMAMPATHVASRTPVAAPTCAGRHETRVARCGVRFESGRCRMGRGGDAVGRVRARASRAWTVVAGASENDDGDATRDPSNASLGEGASIRVADPIPEPASAPATPPRRRRGRPKGTRKVTNAPVPGDAMGVASLLWRLASDDEALNGTARIQPHGLEAVVPERRTRAATADAEEEEEEEETANDGDDDDDDDARASGVRKTTSADDAFKRDTRNRVSVEERRRRASRSAGVARDESTRKKIAARQRERWAAARAEATAKRTADVARALAQKREDAIVAAKRAALEGGAAAANAAARDGVQSPPSSLSPKSPWETLAANAGGAPIRGATRKPTRDDDEVDDSSITRRNARGNAPSKDTEPSSESTRMATDAAERAAAFAALLSDATGRVSDASRATSASSPAPVLARFGGLESVYQSFDASVDDEEDEELRATKRRMKAQLAKLTRRRAEMTGDTGAPSSVTVAKFTAELARYKRLRADLEEWSNAFSEKYRRRPTVKDVERTGIAFLVENFKEYVDLRDKLMRQTPRLRGQMEDVAKATLPTPRVVNKQSAKNANAVNGPTDASGAQNAARRIAAARESKYGAGVSAALGMEPAGPGGRGGPSAAGGRGVVRRTNRTAADGSRGSAGASAARAAALAGKGGSASAQANLAMKRAAAYREANGAANAASRGRGRGRERK